MTIQCHWKGPTHIFCNSYVLFFWRLAEGCFECAVDSEFQMKKIISGAYVLFYFILDIHKIENIPTELFIEQLVYRSEDQQ
jgi:hypothetical protein